MCARSGGLASSHAVPTGPTGGSAPRLLLGVFLLAAIKIKQRPLASKRPQILLPHTVDELLLG